MRARPTRGVLFAAVLAFGVAVAAPVAASAGDHGRDDERDSGAFSYAVYGDAPYGTSPTDTSETDATPAFIRTVNADRAVSAVLHVGDIHSGSQYCTQAYDQQVADLWAGFTDPVVYTPGDNEWTDCHKKKEGGGAYNAATGQIDYVTDANGDLVDYAGGNPVDNLALVRSIFFAKPGGTLGSGRLRVLSQAQVDNHQHPTDGQYVENVMWVRDGVLFASRQRARWLQQRRRPLVRRSHCLTAADHRSQPTAPVPPCAGSTAPSAPRTTCMHALSWS